MMSDNRWRPVESWVWGSQVTTVECLFLTHYFGYWTVMYIHVCMFGPYINRYQLRLRSPAGRCGWGMRLPSPPCSGACRLLVSTLGLIWYYDTASKRCAMSVLLSQRAKRPIVITIDNKIACWSFLTKIRICTRAFRHWGRSVGPTQLLGNSLHPFSRHPAARCKFVACIMYHAEFRGHSPNRGITTNHSNSNNSHYSEFLIRPFQKKKVKSTYFGQNTHQFMPLGCATEAGEFPNPSHKPLTWKNWP